MKEFRAFEAPAAWALPDPDVPTRLHKGASQEELIKNIVRYRSQNDLPPIENLGMVVSTYLCGLPENFGKCEEVALKRGFLQYLQGGIALVKNMMFKDFTSQQVADDRSTICKDCSANVFPDKDMFVKWSDDIAEASVGSRKSIHHDKLGTCTPCSCPLRAKVWYTGPFNLTNAEKAKMSSACVNCWQLKEK